MDLRPRPRHHAHRTHQATPGGRGIVAFLTRLDDDPVLLCGCDNASCGEATSLPAGPALATV